MRKRGRHEEEALAREQPSRGSETAEERGLPGAALRLQELVGNTAATALLSRAELQRDAAPAKPAPAEKKEGGGATHTLTVSDVGTFELLSFSWGASQTGAGRGGAGPGKNKVKEVVCSKYADEHSAKLVQHSAEGRPIAEVTLVMKSGDGSVTFRFKSVHITSYQRPGGGSSGDTKPVETFSFQGDSMEFEHSGAGGQSPGGNGGGSDAPYPG